MATITLGGHDRLKQQVANFLLMKAQMLAAIEAAGGTLYVEVWVPSLQVRAHSGKTKNIAGRPVGSDVAPPKYAITAASLDSPDWSPEWGIQILDQLQRELHNATCEEGMKVPIREVWCGGKKVQPFVVGSKKFFEERDAQRGISQKDLFGVSKATYKPIPAEMFEAAETDAQQLKAGKGRGRN